MAAIEQAVGPYMPTEAPVYRVTDIDYRQWVAEGVTTLLFDVEDTLGETGSAELVPEYVGSIYEAREAGIENVGIRTNRRVETKDDRLLLQAWQEQTEADLVLTPLGPDQAKPSPVMDLKAMQYFGVTGEQTGVIGDKASGDMRAGFFAGVQHRAWTRPFGANRHVGDTLVRGPLEQLLRIEAHLMHTPRSAEALAKPSLRELFASNGELEKLDALGHEADGLDKIVGFGMTDIELTEEMLALVRRPAFRVALEELKNMAEYYGEEPSKRLNAFLHEHGRMLADGLTDSRLYIAALIAALHFVDIDEDLRRKVQTGLMGVAQATDAGDGFSARRHKDGATKKGGGRDQDIDKILGLAIDVFALLPRDLITKGDIVAVAARDIGITAFRKPFKERGIDTKSVLSGKASTFLKAGAQGFGMVFGDRYPGANRMLQRSATALKIASLIHGPFVWIDAHEQKVHEENNLRRLVAQS